MLLPQSLRQQFNVINTVISINAGGKHVVDGFDDGHLIGSQTTETSGCEILCW